MDVRAQGYPDQARHNLGEGARRAVRPWTDASDAHHVATLGDARKTNYPGAWQFKTLNS